MKAVELIGASLFDEDRSQRYLAALDVTLQLDGKGLLSGDLDRSTTSPREESRSTLNNTIEYALSYLKAGGQPQELVNRELSAENLRERLAELYPDGVETVDRATVADTIREAARWLGERTLAVEAARKVLQLLKMPDYSITLPDFSYAEMEADAKAEIDCGLNPFPGFPRHW